MVTVKSEVQNSTPTMQTAGPETLARNPTDARDLGIYAGEAAQRVQPWIRTKARGKAQCEQCREWFGNDELARPETHFCSGLPTNFLATCQYCEKPWTTQEELADHECPSRPGEARKLAQCAKCKTWVVNKKDVTSKHINRCSGHSITHRYNCPTCGSTFAKPKQKELHVNNGCPGLHPDAVTFFDTISCGRCWEEFETLKEYRKHEEQRHPKEEQNAFKCKKCGRGFATKHTRDNIHMTTCGVQWSDRNKHRCFKCDQAFSNPYKRNEHQKACKPFLCQKCRKAFESPQERDQHQTFCSTNDGTLSTSDQAKHPEAARFPWEAALQTNQLTEEERAAKCINSFVGDATPFSYPASRESDTGYEKGHRGLPRIGIFDGSPSPPTSSKGELSTHIAQALLHHRLKRGGEASFNTGRLDASNQISPERFLMIFAKAASESLTTHEIDRLVSSFQNMHEMQNDSARLRQLVNQRIQRFYTEETGLSNNSPFRLAEPSGPPDAELGLLMHCQTKDGQVGEFWDEDNQTIFALQKKGLSSEFAFCFDFIGGQVIQDDKIGDVQR